MNTDTETRLDRYHEHTLGDMHYLITRDTRTHHGLQVILLIQHLRTTPGVSPAVTALLRVRYAHPAQPRARLKPSTSLTQPPRPASVQTSARESNPTTIA